MRGRGLDIGEMRACGARLRFCAGFAVAVCVFEEKMKKDVSWTC